MLLYGMLCHIIPQIEGYGTLVFRVPYGRLLVSVGASKAMVKYCAAAVRAVLHSLKDLANALLDTSKRSQVNSLTGMVSAAARVAWEVLPLNRVTFERLTYSHRIA